MALTLFILSCRRKRRHHKMSKVELRQCPNQLADKFIKSQSAYDQKKLLLNVFDVCQTARQYPSWKSLAFLSRFALTRRPGNSPNKSRQTEIWAAISCNTVKRRRPTCHVSLQRPTSAARFRRRDEQPARRVRITIPTPSLRSEDTTRYPRHKNGTLRQSRRSNRWSLFVRESRPPTAFWPSGALNGPNTTQAKARREPGGAANNRA